MSRSEGPTRYDYSDPDRRGPGARMVDARGREVVLTDETTLPAMLRAGVLTGLALDDANALPAEAKLPVRPTITRPDESQFTISILRTYGGKP